MTHDEKPANPFELLRADQILAQIARDFEIEFAARGEEMTREEAVEHFRKRKALEMVRTMILDKGERIAATFFG